MVLTRSAKASLSHQERTAAQPRSPSLHPVVLTSVTPVNRRINKYRFSLRVGDSINFLPGQWLDVQVPGIDKAGGFTITSSPHHASTTSSSHKRDPFVELAVQRSPDNPPAAWLWQPPEKIIGKEVLVRVGGSFVWPPPNTDLSTISRAVFIAGGVGINPLTSMLASLHHEKSAIEARLLYSTKVPSKDTQPSEVLYLPELLDLFQKPHSKISKNRLELFLTGTWDGATLNHKDDEPVHPLMSLTLPKLYSATEVPVLAWTHRVDDIALLSAIGTPEEARASVFYICGPPEMTDSIVDYLQKQERVEPNRVFCEKWW